MIANLAAGSTIITGLSTFVQDTIGVILLALIGFAALQFLVTRRFMGLIGFMGLAVIVALIFFHPTFITSIANEAAASMGVK